MLLLASKTFKLLHDTGHVADLGLHVVLLLGQLLTKPVSKVEVVSGGPLVAHVVEHVLEVRHAAHLVAVVRAPVVVHPVRGAVQHFAEHVVHVVVVGVVGRGRVVVQHVAHLHHLHHVHLVVSVAGVGVDLVVGVAILHLVHHLGEHGGHVVDVLVVVSLVDHRVDESVARPVGGKGELRSVFVAALGDGLLHVDHDKLHVLLAPAALHGLQLLPLLDHLVVHATKGNGGEGKHDKKLHVVSVSLQGSC